MKTASSLIFVISSIIAATQTSSAQTVAVGNCRSHLVSYSTISEAVAAAAPNSTVLVCPGTYPEQVMISQPLTLKGLNAGTGAYPVITVPTGGLVEGVLGFAQLSAQGTEFFPIGPPVNISNLVVDGSGSGFDCSNGNFIGIGYWEASGSLDNVEVRNQNPGGCGYGIMAGGLTLDLKVNIHNSSIHDFDNTGIFAANPAADITLNLTANRIASTSAMVQAGVMYGFSAVGLTTHTIIATVGGQTGLFLGGYYCCANAKNNVIVDSNVGIYLSGVNKGTTIIANNSLFNNGVGIQATGSSVVKSNFIVQSSIAAVDLECFSDATAEHNIIFGAPIGIANITPGDTVNRNTFFSVPTLTTTCP